MSKKKRITGTICIFVILFTLGVFAEEAELLAADKPTKNEQKKEVATPVTPIQFSFFAPLQIFSEKYHIYGLRLTLPYGSNKSLYGLDVGLVNKLQTLYGLGISALYSKHSGDMYGVNLAGAFNLSTGNDVGLSIAGFFNETERIDGVQMATLHNQAKTVNGVQISLFNYCRKMNGVQIGLLNYCKDQPFRYTLLFNFWDSATTDKK